MAVTSAGSILQSASLYRLWLPLVTVLSMVVVAVVVHPGARLTRLVFSWRPLVEIGKRSYGLYLWHWPIFVFVDLTPDGHTDLVRFLGAIALTIVVSEACYRFVETPIRKGAVGRLWADLGGGPGGRRTALASLVSASLVFLGATLGISMAQAEESNIAVDDSEVAFGFDPDASSSPTGTDAIVVRVRTRHPRSPTHRRARRPPRPCRRCPAG